jgi:hypothetical protein
VPWHRFSADLEGVRRLLSFVFSSTDCRVYESHSRLDQELREFRALDDCEAALDLGVDPHGNGTAQQLSLWSPSVMPKPTIRRVELKLKGYSFRYAIEGCGLFWLHLGGIHEGNVTASSLGYFTEAGGRRKCMSVPGADSVIWPAHTQLAERLRRHVRQYKADPPR